MLDTTDLSSPDFEFDYYIGSSSLQERLRDAVDSFLRRPLYKAIYSKKFANLPYPVDLVLPEKGMSILARRQWVNQYVALHNSRILVIGCGSGWDFGSYLRFKPKEIVGIDLYNFESSWQKIQKYCNQKELPTRVIFHQADIAELDNLKLGEFDIICSDAVFEHCRDLDSVLKVLHNSLRLGGVMYAAYGPLWYCWGGDHFSGRDGIEYGYNHLLLESTSYQDYYRANLQDPTFELQNGGRYIELDLFSKLSHREYFNLYEKNDFYPQSVIIEFSKKASILKSTTTFRKLLGQFPNLSSYDFLIKSQIVILSK